MLEVISEFEDAFGKMSVTKGSNMDTVFEEKGEVSISMEDYSKECMQSSGEIFNGGAKTPARSNLFEIDENVDALTDDG